MTNTADKWHYNSGPPDDPGADETTLAHLHAACQWAIEKYGRHYPVRCYNIGGDAMTSPLTIRDFGKGFAEIG